MIPNKARLSRILVLLALAAVVVGVASLAEAQEVRLRGLGGEELRDADLGQGTTIIVVWASWSPRGRDVVDRVNALSGRWGRQARVITVNFQEDRATVEGFLAGKGMRAPVFLDGDGAFAKRHAVTNLPGLLVVQNGEVAYRGKLPDDPDAVLAEIIR
ncbi:MAG TPA: TlpA disulfide reductase family protein [Longimicrobiaceae bacterium]|nr:TlpA disulfide reductase family protein [Longimicrobiaceae bacterium]